MQILTDRGCDLSPAQLEAGNIHFVPMHLTLDGKTYSSGEDLSPETFYDLIQETESFPTTSQPSTGDFVQIYRQLAQKDPEILSIHVSSGLSGTLDSARTAAAMVPEAHVTFWDTKTLSCPEAWQVEAAVRALQAGWPLEQVFQLLATIRQKCEGMYTLDTLKYLIHGGRISHLKGLLASVLQIRPVIGVDKEQGKYITLGQERLMRRALQKITDTITGLYPQGTPLRVQLLHGKNPDALEILRNYLVERFECHWTPTVRVAPILGAHTGPSLVGLSVGPADVFKAVPGIVMD
jgi:DegV family protein with EDD domain